MCVNTGCNTCTDPCGCTCTACCNNNCNSCCETDPCQDSTCGCDFEVSAACVRIDGNPLDCLGVVTGQTLEQALEAINSIVCDLSSGQDGTDGDSAYEIWLNLGNSGSEQDFIDSLQGASGNDGNDGADGTDGQGIDHTSFTSSSLGGGAGQAGATDTYTVWGDVGETINMGTYVVYNGTNGTNGTDGQDGEFGGWSGEWIFDSNTAANPPVTELRFNNATLSSVTQIYINETNADSTDYSAFLSSFNNPVSGTPQYGLLRIWKRFDSNTFFYGEITNAVDNGSDHTLDVTFIQGNGTFTDTDNIVVSFVPSGKNGTPQLDTGWKVMNDYTAPQGFGFPAYTSGHTHPSIRVIDRQVFISGLMTLPIGVDQDTGATLVPDADEYTSDHRFKYHVFSGTDGGYDVNTLAAGGFVSNSPIIPSELTPTNSHRFGFMQPCVRPIRDKSDVQSLTYTTVFGTMLLQTDGTLLFTTLRDWDDSGTTTGGGAPAGIIYNNELHKLVTRVQADQYIEDYDTTGSGIELLNAGLLEVGRFYIIQDFQAGDDFTNVGAPTNASGIPFVATGTTPTNWTNSSMILVDHSKPIITGSQHPMTWDGNDERYMGGIVINMTMTYPIDETLTDAQVLAAWTSI